jgi:hypothetical protein
MSEMARWQEQEDGSERDFSIVTLAQRLVRKKGEEGLYLYLKRQSEGTWMNSKCQIISKRANLKARVHHLGFES